MARPGPLPAGLSEPSRAGCKAPAINYISQVGPAKITRRASACHVVKKKKKSKRPRLTFTELLLLTFDYPIF